MRYPKFKAYFYNGFNQPKLLATSITGLLNDVTITDNYLGDKTTELRQVIRDYKKSLNFDYLKEDLAYFNIYLDPTLEELKAIATTWFPKNNLPYHHFKEFK